MTFENFYQDAIPGYNVNVDEKGLFTCGCGRQHVFAQHTRVIMWTPIDTEMPTAWYMECAFQYLLTLFDLA